MSPDPLTHYQPVPNWLGILIVIAAAVAVFFGLPAFMDWAAADIGR